MQNLIQKTYFLSSNEWQKKTLGIINKITQNKNNILISGGVQLNQFLEILILKKYKKKINFR